MSKIHLCLLDSTHLWYNMLSKDIIEIKMQCKIYYELQFHCIIHRSFYAGMVVVDKLACF